MGRRGPKSAAARIAAPIASWQQLSFQPEERITIGRNGTGRPWDRKGLSRAERVIRFCETLPVTSGLLAGQTLKLRPWQKKIVRAIYKTHRRKRIVRTALISIPRKNGKTQLAAMLALCHLLGPEAEPRGQVYSAGSDREQAAIIFREMEAIVLRIPEFERRCQIQSFHKRITDIVTGSEYHAMSSDARKAHGLSPSCTIYDELAQAKDRDLYDSLTTGTGARKEPLTIVISTQTNDPHHVLSELTDYGLKIADGILPPDPAFHATIFAAPDDADPWDESVWFACNPALGDFRSLEEMRTFADQARKIPSMENVFRNLYLNQRVDSAARWIASEDFNACVRPIPDLTGRDCYAGLDLSSTQDLSALSLCFPPTVDEPFFTLHFAWCPLDAIHARSKADRVPYDLWHRQGHIEATPGAVVDYSYILRRIEELGKHYKLRALLFDRWGSQKIVADLTNMGLTVMEFGQGFASLSPPSKELEKLVLGRQIVFPENPVLAWCFSNVVVEMDAAGNIKPSKQRSQEKIDLVVSTVMALDGAIRNSKKEVTPTLCWV